MLGPAVTSTERGLEPWKEPGGPVENWGDGRLDIRLAKNPVERDAVYRFRHRVLGGRRGREMGYTESNGRLLEELDVGADLLAAFGEGNTVYASVRLEEFEAACTRRGFVFADAFGQHRSVKSLASFSSALLVDPKKDPHLTVRILASLVTSGARRGFERDYCSMSTNDQLLRGRLGYRESDVLIDPGQQSRFLELLLPAPKHPGRGSILPRTPRWRSIRRRGAERL